MDPRRSLRVAEAMREELEEIIGFELEDPRIVGEVAVTEVLISPDWRHAQVRLHLGGSAEQREHTLEAIEHARHYLRHELKQRLDLFKTPDLHFEADLEAGDAPRISSLIKRIRKGRPREAKPGE
jgi:ribosome-binding factor A